MNLSNVQTVRCSVTGVHLATIKLDADVLASCGTLGWRADWHGLITEHPFFALTPMACLRTARPKLRELIKAGIPSDGAADDPAVLTARVAFVAVLRTMGVIERREGSSNLPYILPMPATVIAHSQSLLELAYWYVAAQSPKFKFPKLNVARINKNTELSDIGAYLAVCREQKEAWISRETGDAVLNALKAPSGENYLQVAAKAERAVIGSAAQRLPKTALWNWLMAAIAEENPAKLKQFRDNGDAEFHKKLFFASDSALKNYTLDDVDDLEGILFRFAPLGTTPFFAFKNELMRMKRVIQKTLKSFTIDWQLFTVGNAGIKEATAGVGVKPSGEVLLSVASAEEALLAASPMPVREDYPSTIEHLRAKARWSLAKAKVAEQEKSTRRTQNF